MFLIRNWSAEHVFEYLNECTQTMIDKHDLAIHYEKNSHDMKWIKEKNDIIFKFERERSLRQRVAFSTSS